MPTLTEKNVWYKQDAGADKKKNPVESAYSEWKESKDDPGKRSAMLTALKPTIESAITSYAGKDADSVRIPAMMMAYDAAKSFDPNKHTQLSTHVFNNLQSLRRKAAERSNVVHVPEGVLLDKNKLHKMRLELQDKIGREPTAQELADSTGISIRRMERVAKSGSILAESQMLNEKGDSLFSRSGDKQKIWSEYVYHDLDPADKKIFEWSTGYGGAEAIKKGEMAARLKISGAAVSKRIDRIIKKLEEGYGI